MFCGDLWSMNFDITTVMILESHDPYPYTMVNLLSVVWVLTDLQTGLFSISLSLSLGIPIPWITTILKLDQLYNPTLASNLLVEGRVAYLSLVSKSWKWLSSARKACQKLRQAESWSFLHHMANQAVNAMKVLVGNWKCHSSEHRNDMKGNSLSVHTEKAVLVMIGDQVSHNILLSQT